MIVNINSFNNTNGNLFFTITGIPNPPNPAILSGATVQKSEDGGLTWSSDTGVFTSPRNVGSFTANTIFRIILQPNGQMSNIFYQNISQALTPIDGEDKIKFINSPLYIRETATALTDRIEVDLWIWSGNQNTPPINPTVQIKKQKVSSTDNYISVEISDLVRPYINPIFAYNRAAPPAITSQGVFLVARIKSVNNDGGYTERFTDTFFCTLGYRWNYEQNLEGDNGVQNYGASGFLVPVNKWYNPKIHNYFFQDFDFTKTVSEATTLNVVRYNEVTPPANWTRCTQDPSLIVFVNKLGLWETFTPHGKYTASTSIKRDETNISHRDPSQVDNRYKHSKVLNSIDVTQKYLINTGSLSEDMISIIEELIYSPLVYLIDFKGDLELVTTIGITIDSTIVTIDSTEVTIDSQTITEEAIGFYKTHQQIPVIVTDEDFTRKTRLNDKINIDYNIKLSETNNKILQIR